MNLHGYKNATRHKFAVYVVIGSLARENHSQYLNVQMRIVIVIRNMRKLGLMLILMPQETLQCQLFGWKADRLQKRVNRKQENIMAYLKSINRARMLWRIIK